MLPSHPLREALHNEVHARPYERLAAPLALSHIALVGSEGSAAYAHMVALLEKRQNSAAKNVSDRKSEQLKIMMASRDALSPLSVLRRGFSITENERGEILLDARQIKTGDKLKIRLASGKLEAEVTRSE